MGMAVSLIAFLVPQTAAEAVAVEAGAELTLETGMPVAMAVLELKLKVVLPGKV